MLRNFQHPPGAEARSFIASEGVARVTYVPHVRALAGEWRTLTNPSPKAMSRSGQVNGNKLEAAPELPSWSSRAELLR
jgi:hypothetical protein